jgi:hypothetical protein
MKRMLRAEVRNKLPFPGEQMNLEKKELGPRTPNFDEHLPRVRAHRAMAEKINQEKCPVPVKGTPKECTTTKGLK